MGARWYYLEGYLRGSIVEMLKSWNFFSVDTGNSTLCGIDTANYVTVGFLRVHTAVHVIMKIIPTNFHVFNFMVSGGQSFHNHSHPSPNTHLATIEALPCWECVSACSGDKQLYNGVHCIVHPNDDNDDACFMRVWYIHMYQSLHTLTHTHTRYLHTLLSR